jgi:putative polyhydroxyalkanoate system protein
MADISITQKHALTHSKAKAAAQKIADKLAEHYDMQSTWNDDVLIFKRSGVSGTLMVLDREAQLDITLGFLFKAFSGKIEEEVSNTMRTVFGSDTA